MSHFFVRGAVKFLAPRLLDALTRQDDEPEEDTWNVATAAGACLVLVSQAVEDEVVQHVMPFVTQNINNNNWKFREAAIMAFGSILEGPKNLAPLIPQVRRPSYLSFKSKLTCFLERLHLLFWSI